MNKLLQWGLIEALGSEWAVSGPGMVIASHDLGCLLKDVSASPTTQIRQTSYYSGADWGPKKQGCTKSVSAVSRYEPISQF